MGNKIYLTVLVRKRKCNERQEIDKRKRLCQQPPVLRMYGITEKKDYLATTSDDIPTNIKPVNVASTGTVPDNNDPLDINCDPAGTMTDNGQPAIIKPINDQTGTVLSSNDPLDINCDPAGTMTDNGQPAIIKPINDQTGTVLSSNDPLDINCDPAGTMTDNGQLLIIKSINDQISGISCFLSNRIRQDCLKKYFGMQRQCGGTNDNRTIRDFTKNSDTLHLVGNVV